jgi:hypothetical protein
MDRIFKKLVNSRSREKASVAYKPLPDGEVIRYMVLQAGKDDEPLKCSLVISPLHKMPYYEAISYVWGSDLRDHEITCNEELVNITHNLWNVLRDVRLPKESRTLWADSICINQEDVAEKGKQVSLMGQIYSKANRVVICLGANDNGNAQAAASLVAGLDEMILKGFKDAGPSYGSFPFPGAEEQEGRAGDERWKSLLALTEEPWFERGWVVQEAGLSADAVITWGGFEINWQKVVRVWIWMEQRLPQVWLRNPTSPDRMNGLHLEMYRTRNRRETMSLYNALNSAEVSFLDLFHYGRSLNFTERSDRVYAFLSLASKTTLPISIRPDYTKHFHEVYLDLARQYIKSTRNIKLLDYIQHTQTTIQDNYPSWVPRWDVNVFEVRIASPYGTNLKSQPIISFSKRRLNVSNKNILKVRGVLFDQVDFKSNTFDEKPSINELISLWSTISHHTQSTSPYAVSDQDIAFAETLSLGRHIGSWKHWELCRAVYIQRLNKEEQQNDHKQEEFDMFQYWVQSCTHKRQFILTRRGYFGLGPPLVLMNDICCVLVGGMSPFILRETSTPGHYKVIGDVYIPSKRKGAHPSGERGDNMFSFCEEGGKDWVEWGLKEQDIYLC